MTWNRYAPVRPTFTANTQHEVEQIGEDLRNGQNGWRCKHCRAYALYFFSGPCPVLLRRARWRARRWGVHGNQRKLG